MNNQSWRHHYLPVFYLKGFVKANNKFKIFDVQRKEFIKKGKEFSPESYFFEKDSNTISYNNFTSDFLETDYYSFFDSEASKIITKINTSNHSNQYGINDLDIQKLNHFVSLMYWRLPHKQSELKTIISNNDLNSLGLSIFNKDKTPNRELEDKFKNNPEFLKSYKFYNSLMDSVRGGNCRTPYTIIETTDEFPFLCSDNPILFKKKSSPKVFEDNYIFPLTGNKLFMRTEKRTGFSPYLRLMVNTLIYKQAVKYVSCTDERYIEAIEESNKKFFKNEEELRTQIFNEIS